MTACHRALLWMIRASMTAALWRCETMELLSVRPTCSRTRPPAQCEHEGRSTCAPRITPCGCVGLWIRLPATCCIRLNLRLYRRVPLVPSVWRVLKRPVHRKGKTIRTHARRILRGLPYAQANYANQLKRMPSDIASIHPTILTRIRDLGALEVTTDGDAASLVNLLRLAKTCIA